MKCYKCKNELKENVQFCPFCGAQQQFDAALIEKAIRKDSEALEQLFHMTKDQVYFLLWTMVGDEDAVFDLMQESYRLAFKSLSKLKNPLTFGRWLKGLAREQAVLWLKKNKPGVFSELKVGGAENSGFAAEDRDPMLPPLHENMEEVKRLLADMLTVLSEAQRFLVGLFYGQRMNVPEIAAFLKKTETFGGAAAENIVKNVLTQARRNLKASSAAQSGTCAQENDLSSAACLMWLYRSLENGSAAISSEAVLRDVLKQSAFVKAASETAKTVGSAAAEKAGESLGEAAGKVVSQAAGKMAGEAGKTAAKTLGSAGIKGVLAKVIAGVTATAVVGGSAVGVIAHNNEKKAEIKTVVVKEQPAQHYVEETEELSAEAVAQIFAAVEEKIRGKYETDVRVDLKDGEHDYSFSPDCLSDEGVGISAEGYFAERIGSGGSAENILFAFCYATLENVQFFEPDGDAYFVTYEDVVGMYKVSNIVVQEDGTVVFDDYIDFNGYYTEEELLYADWIEPLENNYSISKVTME